MLTDVPTARDNGKDAKRTMLAAYAGDTWGTLWRFTLGSTPASVMGPSCTQPLHYAPAVVQLDRDDFTAHPHEVYLVQVTNSALDNVTKDFEASKLTFRRDIVNTSGSVVADTTFGTARLPHVDRRRRQDDVRHHRFQRRLHDHAADDGAAHGHAAGRSSKRTRRASSSSRCGTPPTPSAAARGRPIFKSTS